MLRREKRGENEKIFDARPFALLSLRIRPNNEETPAAGKV